MALLKSAKTSLMSTFKLVSKRNIFANHIRNLTSKQLVYAQFGDPLHVVKFRECQIPALGSQDILVRMLAAPVNPADINTIQGKLSLFIIS